MIDTHAHLQFPELLRKIEEIISQSKKAGVSGVVIASSNVSDSKKAVELAEKYSGFLFASIGIHPQKTDPYNKSSITEQIASLKALLTKSQDSIFAIGETGLDFAPAPPVEEDRLLKDQEKLFIEQVKLAQEFKLPLILHARQANDQLIEMLKQISDPNLKGVFHCYSGGKKKISKILEIPGEWYFGFDGNLTYDQGLQTTIRFIPEQRILVETDSPYLSPEPYRGKVNTPATIPIIVKKINEILGKDTSENIFENSIKLFNLKKLSSHNP
jgi:TatD DNase family protein